MSENNSIDGIVLYEDADHKLYGWALKVNKERVQYRQCSIL